MAMTAARELTREEYLSILDDRFEHGRAAFLAMIRALPKEAFLAQAAAAWDRARAKYGPTCNLLELDLPAEAAKEAIDGVVYLTIEADRG